MNNDWKYVPFSDVFDWCQKSDIGSREGNENGKYPLYIASATEIKHYNDYLENGEALVFGTGGNPCIHFVTGKFAYTNHTEAAKKRDIRTCTKFYYYYFQKDKFSLLQSTFIGGGIKNSSKRKIGALPVPIIETAEQERIVSRIEEMFSQLDASVGTLKKTKAQLAIYRQAVLKEAFEGKLTFDWRNKNISDLDAILSEINEEKAKRQNVDLYHLEYDIPLAHLPNNWKWIFVGDISNGPEYGTSQKSVKEGKIPVIRMGNLQNGEIVWDDLAFSSDDEEIERYRLVKGDVLFNRTNSPELVGKTAIYRGNREAIYAGYLIKVNQLKCINPFYLTYYLNSFTARNYGNKIKTDRVNQSNINASKLRNYPFPLCSNKEQSQVVYELETRLSVCNSIEQAVDMALRQAETIRQSIQKDAFQGRL